MSSQLNVDTIVDKAGSGGTNVKVANTSTYVSDGGNVTQNTVQSLCKFWTQTIGSGTASNNDSFNSSGLTDNGTGDYTHTFTNAMGNNDYSAVGMAIGSLHSAHYNETNTLTTSFRQLIRSHTSTTDAELLSLQICGDLA
jgi:hypothetical protein